jgi:hypothetical protein
VHEHVRQMVTWEEGAQFTKVGTSSSAGGFRGLTDIDYARCTSEIESQIFFLS